MPSIRKRPAALADLETIWFASADSYGIAHAERITARFEATFRLLAEFKELGRARPDLGEGVRSFPVRGSPFLIFYVPPPAVPPPRRSGDRQSPARSAEAGRSGLTTPVMTAQVKPGP
ncbi:type II toxin-antitoxin system RelE/ParE family toxin [Labrys wisconsinensis]|uniref:type II toxin-antitoxin system RelE/ParE family toxin n=1 Tax=Labrys wisconsinensis TaxID=425677 RepID=UPI00351FC110